MNIINSIKRYFGRGGDSHHRFDTDEEVGSVTDKKEDGTLQRMKQHVVLIWQVLPYLWPKGQWELRVRVIVAITCLILGKVLNVVTPFFYKAIVDQLANNQLSFPWLAILGYGSGGLITNFLRKLCFSII
jgi:hypothetical protein